MSRALLDINVLLALLDSDHVDHVRASFEFMRRQPRLRQVFLDGQRQ